MNSWLKVFLVFVAILIAYIGFDVLKLYGEAMAIVFAIVGIVLVFLSERVNWDVLGRLFHPEREIYNVDEWREKAVAALKKNNPGKFDKGQRFEAEIIQSVPIGILYVFTPGLEEKECAFGEVWKSKNTNFILSPLASIENHFRTNFAKTKKEVGLLYLKKIDLEEISLWKKPEITKPTVEVV